MVAELGSTVLDAQAPAHPHVIVPILCSGLLAREFCRTRTIAKVEAVFERSFYLRSGDEFICVAEADIGNGPLTLSGGPGALSRLRLRAGRSVEVCDRHFTVDNSIRLILNQNEAWRPPAWPVCPSPSRLIDTYGALLRRVAKDAPEEGLARHVAGVGGTASRLPALARIARGRIGIFECWLSSVLEAGHTRVIAPQDAIQALIGFGPG